MTDSIQERHRRFFRSCKDCTRFEQCYGHSQPSREDPEWLNRTGFNCTHRYSVLRSRLSADDEVLGVARRLKIGSASKEYLEAAKRGAIANA